MEQSRPELNDNQKKGFVNEQVDKAIEMMEKMPAKVQLDAMMISMLVMMEKATAENTEKKFRVIGAAKQLVKAWEEAAKTVRDALETDKP